VVKEIYKEFLVFCMNLHESTWPPEVNNCVTKIVMFCNNNYITHERDLATCFKKS